MSLHEPKHKQLNNHVRLLLDQLNNGDRRSNSFTDLCSRARIPHDLRAALLQQLLSEKYVTKDGNDNIKITQKGIALATSPLTSVV